ncbi:hypothetical protein J5N97_001806 [Dioscorea zingiberensis]|uniref:Pectinesterase inhibitor domain-containing protein n=1 Tax=Dioscorea zingiberensis TaxID=325984 RepID=A0A9D5BTJ7_9LILI|nr:hypothetical protein J5N97_001806 [Dioscorea zingiberensis]
MLMPSIFFSPFIVPIAASLLPKKRRASEMSCSCGKFVVVICPVRAWRISSRFDFPNISVYTAMVTTLAQAVDAINGRQDDAAKGFLNTAIDGANNCEAALGKVGMASPLTKDNSDSVELSNMALAILALA